MIILASQSASRRAMLDAAGVAYEALPARVDEAGVKAAMAGASPRDLSDALAEMKAVKVSANAGPVPVLGSDSIVALADGTLLDKPESREEAAEHLARMSGGSHELWSAAVIAEHGRPVWRHVERAKLHVRPLGLYRPLSGSGMARHFGLCRLFSYRGAGRAALLADRGSHFTILGMPLLPVLGYLRERGWMAA